MNFDRRPIWGTFPLAYFYLPRSARAYLSPQSVKTHYFSSGPISVDPISPHYIILCYIMSYYIINICYVMINCVMFMLLYVMVISCYII